MKAQKEVQAIQKESVETLSKKSNDLESYQNIDDSIPQYFELDMREENSFSATLGAKVSVHFYNQRKGIDDK